MRDLSKTPIGSGFHSPVAFLSHSHWIELMMLLLTCSWSMSTVQIFCWRLWVAASPLCRCDWTRERLFVAQGGFAALFSKRTVSVASLAVLVGVRHLLSQRMLVAVLVHWLVRCYSCPAVSTGQWCVDVGMDDEEACRRILLVGLIQHSLLLLLLPLLERQTAEESAVPAPWRAVFGKNYSLIVWPRLATTVDALKVPT